MNPSYSFFNNLYSLQIEIVSGQFPAWCLPLCHMVNSTWQELCVYVTHHQVISARHSIHSRCLMTACLGFFNILFISSAALGLSCPMWDLQSSRQHVRSLVAAWEHVVVARGIKFPNRGLNLGLLHWKHWVLASGPPGKFRWLVVERIPNAL